MASEALLIWGLAFSSMGLGFFIYGKKQQRLVPFLCGLGLRAEILSVDTKNVTSQARH